MSDSSLTQVLQRIASQTIDASKLSDYIVGTVMKTSPLEVKISDQLTIDADFIDVCENVTERKIEITIQAKTESVEDHTHPLSPGSTGEAGGHEHDIKLTKKKITIHNALKVGDKVAMLRRARGQKFLIIDKVVSDE